MMEGGKLRRTADYEAGYVVAHVRLGLGHLSVRTGLNGNVTRRQEASFVADVNRAKLAAVAYCAGYAALIAAGYGEEEAGRFSRDDFGKANDLAAHWWNLKGDIAAWKKEAVELMRRPENVAAVALAAQRLLEHRKMDSDWVACVLAFLDGDMSQNEFDDYVRFREALG
jgi:hypothetical protein